MSTIKELVESSHSNAKNKGFYDSVNSIMTKMRNDPNFTGQEINDVENAFIAQRLMLTVSELGEALESNRKNKIADLEEFEEPTDFQYPSFEENFKRNIKDSFQDELADTAIRLFDLAGWLDIDLEKHIELKARYNSGREKMHGKKY